MHSFAQLQSRAGAPFRPLALALALAATCSALADEPADGANQSAALLRLRLEQSRKKLEASEAESSLLMLEKARVNAELTSLRKASFNAQEAAVLLKQFKETFAQAQGKDPGPGGLNAVFSDLSRFMSIARPTMYGNAGGGGWNSQPNPFIERVYSSVPRVEESPKSWVVIAQLSDKLQPMRSASPVSLKALAKDVDALDVATAQSSFNEFKAQWTEYWEQILKKLDEESRDLVKKQEELAKDIAASDKALVERETVKAGIDQRLSLSIFFMILLLPALFLIARAFDLPIQTKIFDSRFLIELIGMAFLLLTIIILGTAEKMDRAVIGTLLGTVGGYIFGQSLSVRRSGRSETWQSGPKDSGEPPAPPVATPPGIQPPTPPTAP